MQRTLGGLKGLALTALIVVPVSAATTSDMVGGVPHRSITEALAGDLVAPAADVPVRCHGTGALIRLHGRIREVGLVRGLLTYQHKVPGTFVRLCGTTPQRS
jgi:hypothetical protein